MGGAVSSGRDNNELIDNLMYGGYIRSQSVERVFRVLDRADFMAPSERHHAYKDLAWRSGALHLSAPCIYSEVMEALELKPGLSFLNLGSGTGYLSTLAGLILGSGGISHGVEIHPRVVEYSNRKLSQFLESSITLEEFDFCTPKFYCGNALCLAPLQAPYDRVYVGAGVLAKYENYFKQLIKVKGVLVMPLGDTLVQIQRVSENEWSSRQLLNVSFALLRAPTKEEAAEPIKLDELAPESLLILCRAAIRSAVLSGVCRQHPELVESQSRIPAPRARPRPRRICIPLDPDTDDPSMNELHDMEGQDGGREMNALLSLVLSMGDNRVAGSLRFEDDARPRTRPRLRQRPRHRPRPRPRPGPGHQGELEALINGIDQHGSDSSSSFTDYWEQSEEAQPGNAAPATSPPASPPAADPELEQSSECTVSGEVSTPAADPDAEGKGDGSSSGGEDSKPTSSEDGPALTLSSGSGGSGPSSGSGGGGGGGGGTKRSGSGSDGARRRAPRCRPPSGNSFPSEVQIYFGNAGVYAGSDVVQPESEGEGCLQPGAAPEDASMERDSSSDDEPPRSTKDTKRQKLDSGIGEGSAASTPPSPPSLSAPPSQSAPPSPSPSTPSSRSSPRTHSPDDSDFHSDSYTDVSSTDYSCAGGMEARRGARRGGGGGGGGSGRARRHNARYARRTRLAVLVKQACSDLPLPHPLKLYVNLHRGFNS